MAELEAEDIAKITSEVLAKLRGQHVDAATLSKAVCAVAASAEAGQPAEAQPEEPAAHPTASEPRSLPAEVEAADASGHCRIILASFGLNSPGIVAAITAVLAENNCSIEDMSQRIMQEFYTLIMIVDIAGCKTDLAELSEKLKRVEQRLGVTILVQHEDVFRYMHRV